MPTLCAANLPIYRLLPQLTDAVVQNEMVVLQAEPGAGKSTQVPLALLNSAALQGQKIIMLEPRRLAAKRLAHFLAAQLDEKVGQRIGYRVRNDSQVSAQTCLEVVTEGVLTRMIQSDPELNDVGLVIFDEFHERNLQADLGLSLLLEIQQGLRDDLKCLIMSATLDEQALKTFLPQAEFLFCEGRTFPVSVSYHPAPAQTPIWQMPQLPAVLKQALTETDGDILLFFAGQGEIRAAMSTCESLCQSFDALALPLYGSLPPKQQDAVFAQSVQRKVIFSTNIAETSLTLQGVTAVVDSGLQKILNYDPNVAMSRLQLQRISQASATQRMGRAGRVQAGHCYRLWSQTQHLGLSAHDLPEICRADLTPLRMELAQWGVQDAAEMAWLDVPPPAHLAAAEQLLQMLGFLNAKGRLTKDGETTLKFHPEPRFAKLLQQSKAKNALALGCDLVALLQEGDLKRSSQSAHSTQTADIELRLHWIWQALADSAAVKRFHRGRWQNYQHSRQRLYAAFQLDHRQNGQALLSKHPSLLGYLLALAYPDRIGKLRSQQATQQKTQSKNQQMAYKLANGRGVQLLPDEVMQADWLVALEVDAQVSGRQQNGRIFLAAALDWQDCASQLSQHLGLQTIEKVAFNTEKQRVEGVAQRWLGNLLVDSQPLDEISAQQRQACLLAAIQQDFSLLPWSKSAKSLLQRAQWLAQFEGFESLQVLCEEALQKDLSWLEAYTFNMSRLSEIKQLNLLQILQSKLDYADLQRLDQEAPISYQAPTGREFMIDYQGRQAKTSLQLQQLFGELASPKLAGGKVPLTFELLSPAQRPIQVTADLANFWQTSYFEVAKEMRGRYPKHRWPEEPLKEKAGASIKRKKAQD